MGDLELKEIFKGCNFEKTDGFRYVITKEPSKALQDFMRGVCLLGPDVNPDGFEYQINAFHPDASNIVTFIDKKLGLNPV